MFVVASHSFHMVSTFLYACVCVDYMCIDSYKLSNKLPYKAYPNSFQDEVRSDRKEGGKRGRKPGRKAADKVDMKAKLGEVAHIIK